MGPFEVVQVFMHRAVELRNPKSREMFKVNRQRVKPYFEEVHVGEVVDNIDVRDP